MAFVMAPVAIMVVDATQAEHPIIAINPAFTRLTGYREEEVPGRNCQFLQGPETDPAAIARMTTAVREAHQHTETVLYYRRDGAPFWCKVHLVPSAERVRRGDSRSGNPRR